MGSYKDLSSRPDGAFTKLMEWQMSGGEPTTNHANELAVKPGGRGPPSETEEIEHLLQSGEEEHEDSAEHEEIQGSKAQETVTQAVEEKK